MFRNTPFINYSQEIWVALTDIAIKNIRPGYLISSHGRIFSMLSKKILEPFITNGYYSVKLQAKNNGTVHGYIHRMIMLSFLYVYNADELQVNHKDGDKLNNDLRNLEWVTLQENVRHAYENNLTLKGEDCPWTKVSNDQVRQICELYITGKYSMLTIAEMVGCGYSSVFDIIHKNNRTDISSEYNIVLRGKSRVFNEEQRNIILKILNESDIDISGIYPMDKICENLGVTELTKSQKEAIWRLYNRNK